MVNHQNDSDAYQKLKTRSENILKIRQENCFAKFYNNQTEIFNLISDQQNYIDILKSISR